MNRHGVDRRNASGGGPETNSSGEKAAAPRCARPPRLHAILGDHCSSPPGARTSASRHSKTTRATRMPTQNEATARTNDAMPAATLGSPSDEDAIIDVREPRWERSVVTAARGKGDTVPPRTRHTLPQREIVVTPRYVVCREHRWCSVRHSLSHRGSLATFDPLRRRHRRDPSVRPASPRSGRRARQRRPLRPQ
jgi:hypothetical protein